MTPDARQYRDSDLLAATADAMVRAFRRERQWRRAALATAIALSAAASWWAQT